MILVKLVAVPVVIWLASYAGRRWGHRVSGLISGFPLISAPIVLFLAFSAPRAFIEETAWITMTVAPAVGAHCLVYAWLARLPLVRWFPRESVQRWHWVLCILGAWTACISAEWVLSGMVIKGPLGALIAIGEMLLALALMPRPRTLAVAPAIPSTEIAVRMLVAVVIAGVIMLGAERFGPRVSGILLGFPITASVLPLFTLYLYGADATIRLLAGFVTGLMGFIVYFFVFASLVGPFGPWSAFVGGVLASVGMVGLTLWLRALWPPGRRPSAG